MRVGGVGVGVRVCIYLYIYIKFYSSKDVCLLRERESLYVQAYIGACVCVLELLCQLHEGNSYIRFVYQCVL